MSKGCSQSVTGKSEECSLLNVLGRSLIVRVLAAALILSSFSFQQSISAQGFVDNGHWVGTWSTTPVEEGLPFSDQTLRQIVHISVGGELLRVRFSNLFGEKPLVINAASIGIQSADAVVTPGSLRQLTFGGVPSVSIPTGARVLSDPVELAVDAEADLAISLFVSEDTGTSTSHTLAHQTSFISTPGDFTAAEDMPVADTTESWFWLTGVEVRVHRNTQSVVTAGDSITEGFASTTNANARYPDELARLLLARKRGTPKIAVLNAGISGNRVLNDIFGPNAQARFDRDVLTQSGVTHVILLEGVNDLGLGNSLFPPPVSAEEIIAGYKQLIVRAHARGLNILIGTILPFRGFEEFLPGYWTAENENKRQVINEWIRTGELHDGVVDFDAALRDPTDPEVLFPLFDSGDHLHPSDEGYAAMAAEAERALLSKKRKNR
jgi:lysophospholipase L1-like esterase